MFNWLSDTIDSFGAQEWHDHIYYKAMGRIGCSQLRQMARDGGPLEKYCNSPGAQNEFH